MEKLFFLAATFFGGTGVALGAFAAHSLRGTLSDKLMRAFETGVQYQMYHAFALLGVAILYRLWPSQLTAISGYLFIGAIIFFSGSLYGLALGGPRWLGPVTPLGGLFFIVGWVVLAVACWRQPSL